MSIQRDYSPNLQSQAVKDFILNQPGPGATLSLPPASRPGYELSSVTGRSAGRIVQDLDGHPLVFIYSEIRRATVIEGRPPNGPTPRGNFDAVIPTQQKYAITVYVQLLLKTGLSPADQALIEQSFRKYLPSSDGAADDFIDATLAENPGLKRTAFTLGLTGEIELIDNPVRDERQFNALVGLYSGTARGEVIPAPGKPPTHWNEPPYFQSRDIYIRVDKYQYQWGLAELPRDPQKQVDVSLGQSENAVEEIIHWEGVQLDCSDFATESDKQRIATLLEYPEFRVIQRDKEFVIADDCGIKIAIIISLPVLQYKITAIRLYGYWRAPKNEIGQYRHVVEGCFWRAALASAVIGFAFANFAAALASFKALFVRCVEDHLQKILSCFIPGLALTYEEAQGWTDLIAP